MAGLVMLSKRVALSSSAVDVMLCRNTEMSGFVQ
jgi:hypothetical protein